MTTIANKRAPGLRVAKTCEVTLSSLHEAPYNPRVMPADKMEALKASLLKHGLVLNLVVQEESEAYGPLVLIGGHQRLYAIRALCAEQGWPLPDKVPATLLDVSDREAKQLNVALNSIEGEFDLYKLGKLFEEIMPAMSTSDITATGFSGDELNALVALARPVEEQAAQLAADLEDGAGALSGARPVVLLVEFETVEQREVAKTRLRAMVDARGGMAGALLLTGLDAIEALETRASSGPRTTGRRSVA